MGRVLSVAPFVFAAVAAWGQQYPFLPVAGSPKSVKSLFQDSRGRLWIGGAEAACFDGTRFFPLRDYGFPAVPSYDFSEDPSGAIWIGAESGVYRFANGKVEEVATGVAVSVIGVGANLAVAAMGPVGMGIPTKATLFRIQRAGARWQAEAVMPLDSPGPLTLDRSGMLLYPGSGRAWSEIRVEDVVRWRPGVTIPLTRHPIANFADNGPVKVMRDHVGCLWVGVDGGTGYDCGDGGHAALFEGADTRSRIHEGADGTMVLWGDSLLAVGRPGSFRIATRANGLPGIVDAIPGRDGTIWLGTTQGLYRMASPFQVEYWTIRDGVAYAPWSVARSGGRVYAGLDAGKIIVLDQGRSRWNAVAGFGGRGSVSALLDNGSGTFFAGFRDRGALLLAADGKVLASTGNGHPTVAMRLARTPGGEVWLGGAYLERVFREGSLLKVENHPLQTQPSRNILAIKYQEQTRKLWACYSGGLAVRDEGGVWKEFGNRDGLVSNGCWSIAPMPNGDVWYANFLAPVMSLVKDKVDGGISVRQYGPKDGVTEPGGDTMDADRRGRLWRGGDAAVYVADAAQAEAGKWLGLDQSDGFPANGMNSGSVFVDEDGSLWWGADNDLTHYMPPSDLVTPQFAPQVFVSAFSWDGQEARLAESVATMPHGRKILAHIGSTQFDRRGALRVRYRILPEQAEWRESGSLDLALGALPAGAHTLEVQGRVFTGPWSAPVSRSVDVLRPVWATGPMLLLYGMALATIAGGSYFAHRRRVAERAELLPNLAAWRVGALLPEVDELAGTVLDSRFEVGELLARGGFANVMDGYDREQKRRCAVKVFRSEVKDAEWIQRRFDQEVIALKKVRHPNVVSIYAHGSAPSGAPYLVMEFIEGRSLREVLENGALSLDSTARILRQLAGALDAIHAHSIWHRDVKPENIVVRNEGSAEEQAVLIDFSIAIVKDANETLHGLSRAAGTFHYMAPEQAIGYAEASSDVYSLAKIVIEMLAGQRLSYLLPDASLDLPDRVRELLVNFKLSGEAIDMLARALEFDPGKRPREAGALAAVLARDLQACADEADRI